MSVVWCAARAAILAGFVVALCIGSAASVSAAPATGEFIRAWQICGPFPARSVVPPIVADEAALNPVSHPTVAGKAWKMLKSDSGLVDLQSQDALGDVDHAVAFAYAEIESEDEGPVILGLGSDDSLAAWWNGRRVLLNDVLRGLHAGDDQVYVRMEKGRNELLLKVYDDGGGFGLAADLRPAGDRAWTWRAAAPLSDDELLELSERRAFEYFAQEADIKTGLMRDSALEERESRSPCSVASVGFGLTGLCIADARGWLPRGEAQRRVKKTLEFLLRNAAHEHGYFYHFLDMRTGERTWNSEASSIDTALLLGGVLTCRNYFRDRDITWLADQLYARVDWPWMLNGADTLAMAWTPESGFTAARWNSYNE
ncbi:MAG: hypothetical protein JXB04_05545, partial [Kiritimatiellae bacterium]|nr:hypothetical protein [Kiritimatiellia bacterium]